MTEHIRKKRSTHRVPQFSWRLLLQQLNYIPRALRLVWKAARGWTIIFIGIMLVQSLLPVLTIYLTREVVDALVDFLNAGSQPGETALLTTYGILFGLTLILTAILGSAQTYVFTGLSEHTQDDITNVIHAQAAILDLSYYESAAYYDQLQRASVDATNHPQNLLYNLVGLFQRAITLIGMAGLLISYAWWLPLAVLAGTLPAFWVTMQANIVFQAWRMQNTTNQRRLTYFDKALTSDIAATEVRLFDLSTYFREAYHSLRKTLRQERLALARQQLVWQLGAALFALLWMGLALLWIGRQALNGLFSLGDLALFWQVISQGQRQMQAVLTSASDIYRSLFFLEDLFSFLALTPVITDASEPVRLADGLNQSLSMQNVTFTYADSDLPALDDFFLTIPAGQIVAIVGENGAGKSTLVKLLCRFYDPQQGVITWDGVDLRHMALADLRRRITVMFQKPVPYHETAVCNIQLGDWHNKPDLARVRQASQAGGADDLIQKLPKGYETVLGKWFGYTELSVGEWQRIALARAFVREASLIILDEPTSAMDSWAENEWLSRFRQLVVGKTALIITHRFTTAMQADVIHVMVGGRIVESGAHADLVALGGRYAASWRAQVREAGLPNGNAAE